MKISWKVNGITGSKELERVNHIVLPITGEIKTAYAYIELEPSEGMFFNGYQTWTISREYNRYDKMRGLNGMPDGVIKRYSLDGYSDYHFTGYPDKKGIFHGFSYCYFRDGERYKFFGSLDERPGYTIFGYSVKKSRLKLIRDASGYVPVGDFHAFDLFYMEGTEEEVFDGWFRELGIKPLDCPKLLGYSSWYNRYERIDEASIGEDLRGCQRILRTGDLFQVDDGWEPKVGDWEEADSKKFPMGMKALSDEIHNEGYMAGLWLAPLCLAKGSKTLKEHPDWVIRDPDGVPFSCGGNWGGFYGLDIDIPECRDYVERSIRRAVSEWGFDLLKLDFLYAGATFGNRNETRAGRMIRIMELIREWAGEARILACGVPLMPCFGRVEYARIGCDVGLSWADRPFLRQTHRERVSTKNSLISTISRRHLNGRVFGNDPDVFFLRTENLELTEDQKHILASVNAVMGTVFLTSDDPMTYTAEQIEKYDYYRHLTEAENVKLIRGIRTGISFMLDGREHELEIPEELLWE